MIESFKNPFSTNMLITFSPRFSVRSCTIGKAPFNGLLQISYRPDKFMLEFESFEKWLKEDLATQTMTIEEVADLVYKKLVEVLHPAYLKLTVEAETIVHAPARVEMENTFK
jgi:NADPH-dependent 7-cyano-7-deazaguanine reductase QueF